ncbi:MAG: OmpH family outer membrane protein [Burkholderiales bacterium]|jgi:outer membrane protein|nr:OmpH family outer membrane protein [Burkholderiales bacterium]
MKPTFRSRIATALVASLMLSAAPTLLANELKIGFVRIDRILKEAGPAKAAQAKLEKEFQGRVGEIQKMDKQARDMQTQLEKDSVTMSESDRRTREGELSRVSRELQRLQRQYREELTARQNEEFAQVMDRANKVVQQLAEQEKFDLILQEAVFISPRIDITDKVLKVLSTDAPAPAPAPAKKP